MLPSVVQDQRDAQDDGEQDDGDHEESLRAHPGSLLHQLGLLLLGAVERGQFGSIALLVLHDGRVEPVAQPQAQYQG